MPITAELNSYESQERAGLLREAPSRTAARIAALSIAAVLISTLAACGSSAASRVANPTVKTVKTAPPAPTTAVRRPSTPVDELVPVRAGARLHVHCTGAGRTTV